MAAWTLVSRVTGCGRVVVIGAVFGPTFFANTFVATNTVPNIIYLSIVGSVLGSVVVPAIMRTTANCGNRSAGDLLGRLAGFLLVLMALASLVLVLGSPLIARLLTFGIADAATRDRAEDLTVVMLLFVAPQIMFYIIAALGAAAQQARGRFALAAAAPAVENVGVMATVVAVGLVYAPHVDMDNAPIGLPILLCLGSTLSVALHMALQLVGAARVGLPIWPRLRRRWDPLTREITHRVRQSFVIAACPEAAYFTLVASAATVPGGVLVLQIAYAVYATLVALGARAVATAVLPALSDAAYGSDVSVFADKVRQGLAYAFTASLPSLFLMVAFAWPIADVLANGELRVGELVGTLAGCIVVLAVAQLAGGLYEVGRQALFARLDIRGPRIAALVGLGVTLTAALFTLLELAGTDRLIGLGGAVLVGDVAAAATVIILLRQVVRPEALADRGRVRAAALASIGMLPVVAGGWFLVHALDGNRFGNLLIVGMTAALALGLFALTLHAATRHPGAAA
ncbi:lipid II flippase MurJ [Mycobacterium sp. NPDC048908]|uniref:lipid II flippase MurJ n=1 Tax=Mycobacterium sp. NPDC048908 TaxID=3364292 RepID=UPI003722F7AB